MSELFWRLFPDVRGVERPSFLFFAGLLTLISLAQTLGLAGSEALFLSRVGVARLPETFIAASLITVLGTVAYAARVGSVRNDDLFMHMLVGVGLLLLIASAGAATDVAWVLLALFCVWYLAQAVFFNHFWTFSGDYFDTLASKRLIPLFTIGSSLGGVLGGVLALGVTRVAHPSSLIVAWGLCLLGAALLLRLGRRSLRRWGPLDLEEADETSMEGILGAVRYLRASSLGRWLVLSALGMVLALFMAQYLYSDIFAKRYPEPAALASFIAAYLAITNLVEISLEVAVTPWLIRRLGVPSANLVHGLTTLVSFGGLAFHYGILSGIAARANRELLDNAVAAPIRSLIYNAMPLRFRGRMRAFLEGIVVYAGMSVAGVVLLVAGSPDPRWLCAAGALAAVVYLCAGWRARRAYLDTLVTQLQTGRIDIDDVGDEIGNWEASRLGEIWEQLLRDETGRPSRSLLQLIPALASRGITEPLVRAASHPSAHVRRVTLNALASIRERDMSGTLALALDDEDASVRLAALRGLGHPADSGFLRERARELLDDPDPRVRAEAALRSGAEGEAVLHGLLASIDPGEAVAALRVAHPEHLDRVLARVTDDEPAIRAAALEGAARLATEPPFAADELRAFLAHSDAGVRRATIPLVAGLDDEETLQVLVDALDDPAAEVQFAAEASLAGLGEEDLAAVLPLLRHERERSVDAALRVVAAAGADGARELLQQELRRRVDELWFDVIAFQKLPEPDAAAASLLVAAYEDSMLRNHRLSFRILGLLENATIIRRVERALRFGGSRARADALEVLSHLGDRDAARLLVLLHEVGPLAERAQRAARYVPISLEPGKILERSQQSELRWMRTAALALTETRGAPTPEEDAMDRLLALKQVPLFATLSLEQLEAVHRITKEVEYLANEVIVREGDPGVELYLLLEGEVHIFKNYGTLRERRLSTMSAVSYFGEMAALGNERRTATVVGASPRSRLLTLHGDSVKELILQMPEISFELFRVLTARISAAESSE